jgi:glyoxylase-like metal-dependent hydrolase (beta-lactamase superfamily II)
VRTRCVGHACLEVEAGGLRLLTDPWWAGPAYSNQWYPWPTPRPEGVEERALDYVYLSHGHEDHLHLDTLARLRRGAVALVPESLTGPVDGFLRETGLFREVKVLRHGETVELREGLRATVYVNLTDSMLVLEHGGEVLLDGNDCLHASPDPVIDYFCRLLKQNHGRIDTLFLGHGGASWYPTCLRLPGTDEVQVAREREAHFQRAFFRVVQQLQPRVAGAFAASFALLEPHNRWINEVKFDMPTVEEAARSYPGVRATRVHTVLPNDVVEGERIVDGGTPRARLREAFAASCRSELREACARVESLAVRPPQEVAALAQAVDARVRQNRRLLGGVKPFGSELRLRDGGGLSIYVEVGAEGASARVGPPGELPGPVLELRTEILESCLAHDYGVESVFIGYGAIARLQRPDEFARIRQVLSLLTPRTSTSWRAVLDTVKRDPARAAGSIWRQRMPLALHFAERLGLVPKSQDISRLQPQPSDRRAA